MKPSFQRVRIGVGLRLGLSLALLGLLAVGLVSYYAYERSQAALVKAVEAKLASSAQFMAHQMDFAISRVAGDVRFLEALNVTHRIANLPSAAKCLRQCDDLADIFSRLLETSPEYLQVRLIGKAQNGKEIVRVDRQNNTVIRIANTDLKEKGFVPDVRNTFNLGMNALYVSAIEVSRERESGKPGHPTLRIAMPIAKADGTIFGIAMITCDVEKIFERLVQDLPADSQMVMTNDQGDYLIHPDSARVFGFTHGQRHLIQSDIPELAPIIDGGYRQVIATSNHFDDKNTTSIGAFTETSLAGQRERRRVILGLYAPLKQELEPIALLGNQMVQFALAFAFVAVLLLLFISRRLAKPVMDMSAAIRNHELGKPLPPLPISRHDEIGDLARSFVEVSTALNEQAIELKGAMGKLMESEKLAALGKLVAGVAHELNTPLGNSRTVATTLHEQVLRFKSSIADNSLRRSTVEEFLKNAEIACELLDRNTIKASTLIESFKRVAVDQESELRRQYDLRQVVSETLQSIEPSFKHKPVEIDNQVPHGISMDGYPGALSQAVINLINNAVIHGLGDHESLVLKLLARDNEASVTLQITDDGMGMDELTAKRALEPFFTTRLGSGGSGLGLYLVYNLVTATLGGNLSFKSVPGEGTCFDITLPKTAPSREA